MFNCYRFRLHLIVLSFAVLCAACSKHHDPPAPVVVPPIVKLFDSFSFNMGKNPALTENIAASIVGDTIFANTFAGTDISNLIPEFTIKGGTCTSAGKAQVSGQTANDFGKLVAYTITATDNTSKTYTVKFTSTGLPVIYLNTNNIAIADEENYIPGTLKIAGDLGTTLLFDGKTSVKGRGNSTWGMPKKPYKIKLDKKAGLLGMSEGKNWVLLANYADKSLMRNELAFDLSRHSGLAFTPNSRFVELFLNGEYQGNYQLTEQVNQGASLVNVETQATGANTLPDITGGYLIEVDGFADGEPVHFATTRNMPVTIHYPDNDVINQQQKDYIGNHVQKFEDALFADNFADPAAGYRKYFDVASYINYYLVNEVLGNSDIFWSTYMYKKRNDDKLYTGPVWDFDIAANNDNRIGNAVNQLMLDAGHDPKTWINRLMQDPLFRQQIRARWNVLSGQIKTLPATADALAGKLALSEKRNFAKWDILSTQVYLEYQVAGSYPAEIAYLKNYLTNRINWLDGRFNSAAYQ